MTPQPRSRLPAADRRRTILDAALQLFGERGYAAAAVNEIAAAAGINVAVIYSHFPSKEALHAAVLDEQWQDLLAYQADLIVQTPPGRERLRVAFTSFFGWCEANPLGWRLVFRDVGGPPAVVAAHERVLAALSEAIAALLAGEDPADPRLAGDPGRAIVAEYLKGGMNAVARWWYDHPDVEREALVELLLDVTWQGFQPLSVEGERRPPA